MICRAFRATEGLFDARVVVTRHREVANLARERGIAVVLHDLPLRSDTVRLGLQAVGEAAGCLFCPGDQPLLRRETVAELAGHEDTSFLERTYCHPQDTCKEQAAGLLDTMLQPADAVAWEQERQLVTAGQGHQ